MTDAKTERCVQLFKSLPQLEDRDRIRREMEVLKVSIIAIPKCLVPISGDQRSMAPSLSAMVDGDRFDAC